MMLSDSSRGSAPSPKDTSARKLLVKRFKVRATNLGP